MLLLERKGATLYCRFVASKYSDLNRSEANFVVSEYSDLNRSEANFVVSKYSDLNRSEAKLQMSSRCVMILKTIRYSSVKHNQVLLNRVYMFVSEKTTIRPTLQKLLTQRKKNIVQLCSLHGIQYDLTVVVTTQNL